MSDFFAMYDAPRKEINGAPAPDLSVLVMKLRACLVSRSIPKDLLKNKAPYEASATICEYTPRVNSSLSDVVVWSP